MMLRRRYAGKRASAAAAGITRSAYTTGFADGPIATPAFSAGDFLLIVHANDEFNQNNVPTGWNAGPRAGSQSPNAWLDVFWKIATGTETYPISVNGLHYMGVYKNASTLIWSAGNINLMGPGTDAQIPAYNGAPAGSWLFRAFTARVAQTEAHMDAVLGPIVPLAKRFGSLSSGAFGDSNGILTDIAQTNTTITGSDPKVAMTFAITPA